MPENIECAECGLRLLGFVVEHADPRPVGGDECPDCGGSEFTVLDG